MTPASRANFVAQWVLLNTAALLVGYALYTPIAHGIAGGHESRELTATQLTTHAVALAVVAALVATAQRHVLGRVVPVSWMRVPVAAVVFNIAFWIGYYQPWLEGPDTDILLGYLTLGSAVWLGNVHANGHRTAAAIALLSFPIASVVGEVCLFVAFTVLNITPAMQTNELHHSIFWITVGGVTGVLGGWLGGLALVRMLPPTDSNGAAQQALAADVAKPRG
jgi:hypothetical protein